MIFEPIYPGILGMNDSASVNWTDGYIDYWI